MPKPASSYVCQNCGAASAKWSGRCDACGAWNTIIEEASAIPVPGARGQGLPKGRKGQLVGLKGEIAPPPRLKTGMGELDRVAGGGFVQGSAALVGGDPGIGKSTLLLQAMAALARKGEAAVYISGEEAIAQVQLRAERLSLTDAPVMLASLTNVADIIATLSEEPMAKVVVIDSIQTLWTPVIESAPGTVSQLRAGSEALIRLAKSKGISVLFVGHVTKEGDIAGPKVIEHLVDTVLYFEGDRGHQFRILRAVKNRFGPTDEIGVFEMSDAGLKEVNNPSRLFMGARENPTPGSAVFAGIEGTRPLLMEVQALVSPSVLGNPRRAVVGWDQNRLAMVLAVLEARGGVAIGANDVYLNVAGGLKVREPAADLAVAAALLSSMTGKMLPQEAVFFGEIALSGSIRPVSQSEARLKEAAKLGMKRAILAGNGEAPQTKALEMKLLESVSDLVAYVASR
jgi:DNA repair protein RadA/Sms